MTDSTENIPENTILHTTELVKKFKGRTVVDQVTWVPAK